MKSRQRVWVRVVCSCFALCLAHSTFSQVPTFSVQPQSQTVQVGQPTVTSVTATGGTPISYQWFKNGGIIASATNSSYTWSNPSFIDAGTYYAMASNSSGSTESADMTLAATCPQGGANDFQFGASAMGGIAAVSAAVQLPNGKLCIGGGFTKLNGVTINRIARLNVDGSIDSSFMNGLSGANNTVRCVLMQPNGKLVVGGYFTSVNGTNENRVARLNTDGTLDPTFSCQINGGESIGGGSLRAC